jgi:hypothetical protein
LAVLIVMEVVVVTGGNVVTDRGLTGRLVVVGEGGTGGRVGGTMGWVAGGAVADGVLVAGIVADGTGGTTEDGTDVLVTAEI